MIPSKLRTAIEAAIGAKVEKCSRLDGGSINETFQLSFVGGASAFVKFNRIAPSDIFIREAEGLRILAEAGGLRVPKVLSTGTVYEGSMPFLVLEYIPVGSRTGHWIKDFGRGLANIHRRTALSFGAPDNFGFYTDNYIGTTKQPNTPTGVWADFFLEFRLEYLVRLISLQGKFAHELSLIQKLFPKFYNILGHHDPDPVLVHGDLWSGNVIASNSGEPVLIDPAVYFADREVDIAMAALFGGFDIAFLESYQRSWKLSGDYLDRQPIYQLYHLLHHALLFGGSYMEKCLQIAQKFS